MHFFSLSKQRGMTIIEALIAITIFAIAAIGILRSYTAIIRSTRVADAKISAVALANEQIEIIRNMPYAKIGTQNGIPLGTIPPVQHLSKGNFNFSVITTIRNIDDPFDGTIGGTPNDLSPADSRFVQVDVSIPSFPELATTTFTTRISPNGLETTGNNGALFIQVFDANGQPVKDANVHIANHKTTTTIDITDTTNSQGLLQIVDAPTSSEGYEITVNKSGYSSEKTYPTDSTTPTPINPHATIATREITQISLPIDKTSTLKIYTLSQNCTPIGNIPFSIIGNKLINAEPKVYKYDKDYTTDYSGEKILNNMEWDAYKISLDTLDYDLIGTIPAASINLAPNTTQDLKLILAASNPKVLLVNVKDGSTNLPLSNATVLLEKSGYSANKITGRGFQKQTDWSAGSGQEDFTNVNSYYSDDGNMEKNDPAGEIKLRYSTGEYIPEGNLISSTFDTGLPSNFDQLIFAPPDQPAGIGSEAVKFQLASRNTSSEAWIFVGPGNATNTYYFSPNSTIGSMHNGKRYLRYKLFLSTASSTLTPALSDISFTYTTDCMPPGQVNFTGLAADTYDLTVSKNGYNTTTEIITVGSNWQEKQITLTPQ